VKTIPIHLAIDIEPDERLPLPGKAKFDSAGIALAELSSRRAAIEEATGAKAAYGWYLRMDRHIAALYGDPTAIADRFSNDLKACAEAGDEVGLHIHSIEQDADGAWRSNYADASLVEATIDEAAQNFVKFFGHKSRAVRMGEGWTSPSVMAQLARLGLRYDATLEAGLRPISIAAFYPGTNTVGDRASTLGMGQAPFRPALGGDRCDDYWALPLSSYRRRDFAHPGFWLVSAYAAATTGLKQCRARSLFRPQEHAPRDLLRRRLDGFFAKSETPCLNVAIRNFGACDDVLQFIDVLCEIARERPLRFVGPADYVAMTGA